MIPVLVNMKTWVTVQFDFHETTSSRNPSPFEFLISLSFSWEWLKKVIENATTGRWLTMLLVLFFMFGFFFYPWKTFLFPWRGWNRNLFYVASMLQHGEGRRRAQQRDGGESIIVCIRKQPRAACWIVNKVETLSMHDWSPSVPASYNTASHQASPPSLSLFVWVSLSPAQNEENALSLSPPLWLEEF